MQVGHAAVGQLIAVGRGLGHCCVAGGHLVVVLLVCGLQLLPQPVGVQVRGDFSGLVGPDSVL